MSFLTSVFIRWSTPKHVVPTESVIPPANVSSRLKEASERSQRWDYSGHTGRYVRAVIWPRLVNRVSSSDGSLNVKVIIINPLNEDVISRYTKFRNQSRSSAIFNEVWDNEKTKIELLATIISTLRIARNYIGINVDIHFHDQVRLFRIDRTDDNMIVTQEDPQRVAYEFHRGSQMFDFFERQLKLDWEQTGTIRLSNGASNRLEDDDAIIEYIKAKFSIDGSIFQYLDSAFDLADNPRSPYA